ncbi:MAG: hypothetical protein ABR583_13005 [Gaiellaceae bacterium]
MAAILGLVALDAGLLAFCVRTISTHERIYDSPVFRAELDQALAWGGVPRGGFALLVLAGFLLDSLGAARTRRRPA